MIEAEIKARVRDVADAVMRPRPETDSWGGWVS
jgi:hypothetical protein